MQNHIVSMDPEFEALRSIMRNEIEEVLLMMQPNPSSGWMPQLRNIVTKTEEHIFKDYPNKETYAGIIDQEKVKGWIMSFMDRVKLRRQQQEEQQQNQHSMTFFGCTTAAAGPHQPDLLLVQQHQSQRVQAVPSEEVQAPSTTSTNEGSSSCSEKERRYLAQIKFILLLHHARSCPATAGNCPEKNCGKIQKFVKHIESCSQEQCSVHKCPIARKCLLHFQGCKDPNCPVCVPVHKVLRISKQKALSLKNGLNEGVSGKEVDDKTETEPALSSDQRNAGSVFVDLSKSRNQLHLSPQPPLPKRQRVHVDVFQGQQQPHLLSQQSLRKSLMMNMDFSPKSINTANPSSSALQETKQCAHLTTSAQADVDPCRRLCHFSLHSQMVHQVNQEVSAAVENEERSDINAFRAISEERNKDGTASKSEKSKLKCVSMMELFAPEQVREDISSLKQWISQSKIKVDEHQAMEHLVSAKPPLPKRRRMYMDVFQGQEQPHLLSQQSLPKSLMTNMDASPKPVNTANPSFSALEETEQCAKNADAKLEMNVITKPVSQNLEIASGVPDTSSVQMSYVGKVDVILTTSAQADVDPASPLQEIVHQVNQEVSAAVENEETIDISACKSISEERNKDGTASKSEKPKLKGVSMMELFAPGQVREHISSLRQSISQSKTKVDEHQAMEHLMSENSCQLCMVERLPFEPTRIYCTLCWDRIKRNAMYYTFGTGKQRRAACMRCYNAERGETIQIENHMVPKARFEKKKNDEETEEPWVQCDKCEAWQHQICALFNGHRNNGGQAEYTCPKCYLSDLERGERVPLPESAMLRAKDLPRTRLSDYIEGRLSKQLERERRERATYMGKKFEDVPAAEGLVLRVVSSVDKRLEVKPGFSEIFQEENYPTDFPYKSKTILLFQNIEGVEVCLFALYVQEFGTECAFPNQRCVYISYLDSVRYFKPEIKTIKGEALRTFVYHEILIGYLEFCKKRGFVSCYIWACPPSKGDDYFFYCHPEIQKTPKPDKLRKWYLSMLTKGMDEKIVVGRTNLYDHFFTQQGESKVKMTAVRVPYFDGDYWPRAADDMINRLLQEENDLKRHNGETRKNTISKYSAKTVDHTNLSGKSKDAILMEKLGKEIRSKKDDFIMVHLQHACDHCRTFILSGTRWVCNSCPFNLCESCHNEEQLSEENERHPTNSSDKHTFSPVKVTGVPIDTKDQDDNIESEFFSTRDAFLSLCQGNHYQYDTLRRAKHSSMMVLYHLHNPTAPAFIATCNICSHDIETGQGWCCNVCPEFELCNSCYEQDGAVNHPHQLTNHSSSANKDAH